MLDFLLKSLNREIIKWQYQETDYQIPEKIRGDLIWQRIKDMSRYVKIATVRNYPIGYATYVDIIKVVKL